MLNVAYVLPHVPRVSETFVRNEIRGLSRSDEVNVVVLYSVRDQFGGLPRTVQAFLRESSSVRGSGWREGGFDLSARLAASNLARMVDSSIDHVHSPFLNFPARVAVHLSAILRTRVSATAHAADYLLQPRNRLTKTLSLLDHVFAISEKTRLDLLHDMSSGDRLSVVRAAVDPKLETVRIEPSTRSRQRTSIITVARLVEKKGLFDCIEVGRELKARGADFNWSIVGDGPLRERLAEFIRDCGMEREICLLGARAHDEVLSLVRAADIGVLLAKRAQSGDEDGLPIFVLECAAFGVPLVTTNVGGIADVYRSIADGSIFCLEPDNRRGVVEAISLLSRDGDLRYRLAERLNTSFRSEFLPSMQVRRYLKVWRELSNRTSAGSHYSSDEQG